MTIEDLWDDDDDYIEIYDDAAIQRAAEDMLSTSDTFLDEGIEDKDAYERYLALKASRYTQDSLPFPEDQMGGESDKWDKYRL